MSTPSSPNPDSFKEEQPTFFNVGLQFYWYEWEESKRPEAHALYWGQLCGSMHRLVFVREEFNSLSEIDDIKLVIERLNYHMENYLVRVYELRERAVKLLQSYAKKDVDKSLRSNKNRQSEINDLKSKRNRESTVNGLLPDRLDISKKYLELLALIDNDIDLRNQNTHDSFLILGYSDGYNMFDPIDAIQVDFSPSSPEYCNFVEKLKKAIDEVIEKYNTKIHEICRITEFLLQKTAPNRPG